MVILFLCQDFIRSRMTSRPYRLKKTNSIQSKRRDLHHTWLHRETNEKLSFYCYSPRWITTTFSTKISCYLLNIIGIVGGKIPEYSQQESNPRPSVVPSQEAIKSEISGWEENAQGCLPTWALSRAGDIVSRASSVNAFKQDGGCISCIWMLNI